MSVTVGNGVIYRWFDVREDQLENIESWTDAAKKIRQVTDDVLRMAIAGSPKGRERDDQFTKIEFSHYKAPGIKKVFKSYQQVVGNRAPHALWVHEGTDHIPDHPIVASGPWQGPVYLGGGVGQVSLAAGPPKGQKRKGTFAKWKAYPSFVYFQRYMWHGQAANPWLADAGHQAYRLGNNH